MTICPINMCNREVGLGTHMRVRATKDTPDITVKVCENHWQAIREVAYLSNMEEYA